MDMGKAVSVLVAGGHALVRDVLVDWLRRSDDLTIIGTVAHADEAVGEAIRLRPDVILMDVDAPADSFFDAVSRIHAVVPGTRVVFLSASPNDRSLERALKSSASGYVSKQEPPTALVQAIFAAAAASSYYSPELRERLVRTPAGFALAEPFRSRTSALTAREKEILSYLTLGKSKKEVAQALHISAHTVSRHTASVMSKLGIHDRVQLARYAIREGYADVCS